jgi:hypothetical protein
MGTGFWISNIAYKTFKFPRPGDAHCQLLINIIANER